MISLFTNILITFVGVGDVTLLCQRETWDGTRLPNHMENFISTVMNMLSPESYTCTSFQGLATRGLILEVRGEAYL